MDDCTRLESGRAARLRGFESPPFRHIAAHLPGSMWISQRCQLAYLGLSISHRLVLRRSNCSPCERQQAHRTEEPGGCRPVLSRPARCESPCLCVPSPVFPAAYGRARRVSANHAHTSRDLADRGRCPAGPTRDSLGWLWRVFGVHAVTTERYAFVVVM